MIILYDDLQMCKQEIAANAVLGPDEYIDAEDGLVHCSVCRERRMSVVKRNFFQGYFFPRCPCSCQIEEEQKKKGTEENATVEIPSVSTETNLVDISEK